MTLDKPRIDSVYLKWAGHGANEFCQAIATVSYAIGNGDRRIGWLTSGGLSGIDCGHSDAYRRGIEEDELADLADHLEHFGITMTAEQRKAGR